MESASVTASLNWRISLFLHTREPRAQVFQKPTIFDRDVHVTLNKYE